MIDQRSIYMYTSDNTHSSAYIDDLSCNRISVEQQLADVGSAHIVSVPAGAKIFIDYIGDTGLVTPVTIPNIPVGVHTYKLTYPEYTDVDGLLFIELNKTYELSVIMERIPGYFDPTKLILYSLAAGIFMLYLSQSGKGKKWPIEYEKHEETLGEREIEEEA